ncbi:MAG: imidazole glycerol phosphate synthase subunit HisH [Proteobacteria bacterium]|nr:imidazole glycerol phosphate synthase subunit HisH [Pseudomonadota bacterium]
MIAIIDYDAGNLTSVARALSFLGFDNVVTSSPDQIFAADRVIFPGVGSAGSAMASLKRLGMDRVLNDIYQSEKPLLGICLGTQIILGHSEEHNTPCIGIVEGNVLQFDPKGKESDGSPIKIPHMGWNRVNIITPHPILSGLTPEDEFYFVHSYYPAPQSMDHCLGMTFYGVEFASIIGCRNLIATQFHPEKSGRAGLRILKNFCEWTPC